MENQEHIHSFEDIIVPATCQQQGYTLHRCACGYEHKDNFKPVGDHTFQVTQETAPDCLNAGQQTLQCQQCGTTEIRPVAALGHSFGQWNVLTLPTCTENGAQRHTCTRCGITEEQVIKAKGHTLTNPRKSATKKGAKAYFCPDCGQTIEKVSAGHKLKKLAVVIAAILAVVTLAAIIVPPLMGQAYNYYMGKFLISIGQYEKAYYMLQGCVETTDISFLGISMNTTYYKDTEDILADFLLLPEEYTTKKYTLLDEAGEITQKIEANYDEKKDQIQYTEFYNYGDSLKGEIEYTEFYEDGKLVSREGYDLEGNLTYEYVYKYDKNGNQTLFERYDADGNLDGEREYHEYDKDGNLMWELKYDYEGAFEYKYVYEYDKDGNRIHREEYDAAGNVKRKQEYKYDENGNLVLETSYDDDGNPVKEILYEYDEKGNLTLRSSQSIKMEMELYKVVYEYDHNDNLVLYEEYNFGKLLHKEVYKYNEDKKLTNVKQYGSQGKLNAEYECKYDENGRLTQLIRCNENRKTPEVKYKYDKNGNMICETTYNAGGEKSYEKKWEGYTVIYLPKLGK